MEYHQLTFDDLRFQEVIGTQADRTAFIDEFGSFGFDFSSSGASKYYILCAIIIEDSKIDAMHKSMIDIKKNNGFAGTELKSSIIGNNYQRRTRILSQLLMVDFRVVLLVADKQAFIKDTPLTEYKKSFIKYLHGRLYNLLYHVYPKLKIIEDEIGTSEFQKSFRQYVSNNRPQYNLLNDYDFDYVDSKDELLVQLADIVGGSIGHSLSDTAAPNYQEMLKWKILATEYFPNKSEPYWGMTNLEDYKYNKDIHLGSQVCLRFHFQK